MTMHTFSGVFMFTDIVDSTALWSTDPKAMFVTVVKHNERCAPVSSHTEVVW